MTETDPSALLPIACPFCGKPGRIITMPAGDAIVSCVTCGLASTRWMRDKDQAIAAWNRRAPVAPISATLEGSAQHHDALTAHQVGRTPAVTEITDAMVEAATRDACAQFYGDRKQWYRLSENTHKTWRAAARAALTAALSLQPQASARERALAEAVREMLKDQFLLSVAGWYGSIEQVRKALAEIEQETGR